MTRLRRGRTIVTGVALSSQVLLTATTFANDDERHHHDRHDRRFEHVLLLSIDGLHGFDLTNCIASNLCPSLAKLAQHGTTYANASTTKPSDSFPGLLAQLTGGTPKSTGVYYDDSYDRTLFAPISSSTTPCASGPGAEAANFENLDKDKHSIDGGVPASLTGPTSAVAIDPNHLPLQRVGHNCTPLWPHNFVRTNTIFQVIHRHHLRTAWSDKHPAYDLINGNDPDSQPADGPGSNVDEFFAPEINSDLSNANVQRIGSLGLHSTAPAPVTDPNCPGSNCGSDFTSSIDGIEYYDGIKVSAVLNELNGFNHMGTIEVGTPAILGMNFQSVSVGQKLKIGGYKDAIGTPSDNLANAIGFVDRSIGQMMNTLQNRGLAERTLVIVSAKHGQSPVDRTKRVALDDGAVIAAPIGSNFAFDIADDGVLIWLKDNSGNKTAEAVDALKHFAGDTGIASFLYGDALADMFRDPARDSRAPDIVGIARVGVIYTGGSKIAEHGGFNPDDVHVALLVSHPDLPRSVVHSAVATTQIAPTILNALGLDPDELEAVRMERTRSLPGFD